MKKVQRCRGCLVGAQQLCFALLILGCFLASNAQAQCAGTSYKVGDKVEGMQNPGSPFYKGTIIEINGCKFKVNFYAADMTTGTWITADMIRARPTACATSDFKVGDRVGARFNDSSPVYPGTITSQYGCTFKVHTDKGVGETEMTPEMLQHIGAPAKQAAPKLGYFHCTVYNPSYGLQDFPSFTLKAGAGYDDSRGGHGTYAYDVASRLITFHGGAMDGAAAQLDGTAIRLFNKARTRTVVDCAGPN